MEQSALSSEGDRLSRFTGKKHISLETYRKIGNAVRTPVWFVEENGQILVRTDSTTGKIKRIRNNPRVRIAPCNARGTVKGEWVDGEARMVEPESSEHIFSLLKKKYGMSYRMIRLLQRFRRSKAHPIGLAIQISA